MPVKKLSYNKLDNLIKENLSVEEHLPTADLIKKLRPAKQRGWLNKDEMIDICNWKSPRAIWHIRSNSKAVIKKQSALAFSSRSEEIKISELTKLKGVSIPMASAILMLTNPKRYGVIDIRVWEVLLAMGTVNSNSKGINFKFKEWYRYLMIIRYYANMIKVSARDIERTLFIVHQENQDGLLYRNLPKSKK
jgi:hypothetical protein